MRKLLLLPLLLLAACGGPSEPVIKTQVHLVKGMEFETLLEGTADLDGGRIEQAVKDESLPIDLQVVVTREGEGEDFAQRTLTFHMQERGDQYVLVRDTDSGKSDAMAVPRSDGLEPFLRAASEKIAAISNSERRSLATKASP